jgi:AbrB family looped-hinge helix DNA binding protein
MDAAAKVSSKGQITLPKAVREALGIEDGDDVVFRVEGKTAMLAKTPDFLTLANTFQVPAMKRNAAWDDVIRRTRAERSKSRR